MKVEVNKMEMPIDESVSLDLYRVDIEVCDKSAFDIYRWRWKTFGVYESKDIAEFIADSIRNEVIEV
jgi:hypothetical protein